MTEIHVPNSGLQPLTLGVGILWMGDERQRRRPFGDGLRKVAIVKQIAPLSTSRFDLLLYGVV